MRADHCACEFNESWGLQLEILESWVFANVDFMRVEFENVHFIGAEHCECNFCESWLWIWILWELSIANANFMRAKHYTFDFFIAELCKWDFMRAE